MRRLDMLGGLLSSDGRPALAKEIIDTSERIVAAARMTDIFPSGVRWTMPLETPSSDAPRATRFLDWTDHSDPPAAWSSLTATACDQ
jgi:hypothetical protein